MNGRAVIAAKYRDVTKYRDDSPDPGAHCPLRRSSRRSVVVTRSFFGKAPTVSRTTALVLGTFARRGKAHTTIARHLTRHSRTSNARRLSGRRSRACRHAGMRAASASIRGNFATPADAPRSRSPSMRFFDRREFYPARSHSSLVVAGTLRGTRRALIYIYIYISGQYRATRDTARHRVKNATDSATKVLAAITTVAGARVNKYSLTNEIILTASRRYFRSYPDIESTRDVKLDSPRARVTSRRFELAATSLCHGRATTRLKPRDECETRGFLVAIIATLPASRLVLR